MTFKYILIAILSAFLLYVLVLPRRTVLRKGAVAPFVRTEVCGL